MPVVVADEQESQVDTDDLVDLARHVLRRREVPEAMEVSLLLVDEATMADLNVEHMGGSGATDVLAFPIDAPGEAPPGAPAVLGDVVLCPEVAGRQAAERARARHDELRLLTVHGLLHLLGWDHAEPDEERAMFALTDELLAEHASGVGG